uniref:Uncharacterized protein n=1 Tax=Catagonus wagneri TaxID=51154 RepID=A0A8C3YTY6_9CETA
MRLSKKQGFRVSWVMETNASILVNTPKCEESRWHGEGRKGRIFCVSVSVYTFPRILHSWDTSFLLYRCMSQTKKNALC